MKHIFISYSSRDRAWAAKLEADLKNRNVDCFLDTLRLSKGQKWEPQLLNQLLDSRHFIVLWSENARQSDWVNEELYRFKAAIDPKGEGQPAEGRLLYALNLQGQNATLAPYQAYLYEGIQKAYQETIAKGTTPEAELAAANATAAWNKIMDEIATGATANDPAITVPVAVLALTTALIKRYPPLLPELNFVEEKNVDDFLTSMGVGNLQNLEKRYDTDSLGWHPFGGAETIKEILTTLLYEINENLKAIKKLPIRWSFVDVITPALNLLGQAANPLVSGPSMLIIDPISLFSVGIWKRYVQLGGAFANPQAAIILPTPIVGPQPLQYLRQCLSSDQGRPHLDWYNEPIPYRSAYANCGVNIADRWDIRRLVLASLGRQPSQQPATGGEGILNT